jgi:hypothetical protein
VHNVNNLISFEEPEPKKDRWARSILFSRKSFELSYSKSQERKVCVGDRKMLQGTKLRRDITFTSVDEIQELDSQEK